MDSDEATKIKSCIKAQLINESLKKGGLLAAPAALLIILSGSFLPLSLLKIFGIPIFFIGVFFIGLGLLPYKKLSRLQLNPHELQEKENFLIFFKSGKPLLKIPKASIEKMEYVEKELLYGYSIKLKKPIVEKIKVLQPKFDFEAFMEDSKERFGCDLFLPYFQEKDLKTFLSVCVPDKF